MKSTPGPTRIDSKHFATREGILVSTISEIGSALHFASIYEGSTDKGFTLVLRKTGKEVVFAMKHIERKSGDVICWDLVSVTPGSEGMKARIYNK